MANALPSPIGCAGPVYLRKPVRKCDEVSKSCYQSLAYARFGNGYETGSTFCSLQPRGSAKLLETIHFRLLNKLNDPIVGSRDHI